ncbi:MAG: DUF1489 domain-containing protein [Pseudomonadota bacterium]
MRNRLHLIKLCVGADTIEDLAKWQATKTSKRKGPGLVDRRPCHVTRMFPRRAEEILAGGSLFWVIKGAVLVRQRILALESVTGEDGHRRCAIVLDPDLVRTVPLTRGPFQGWRYLTTKDAPPDLSERPGGEEMLPPDLGRALSELGVLPAG